MCGLRGGQQRYREGAGKMDSLISEAYPLREVSNETGDKSRDVLVFASCIDQNQFIFSDELVVRRVVDGQGVRAALVSEYIMRKTRYSH